MTYVRLSVPISRDMANAASRLRQWVSSAGFTDLCAGAVAIDVGTLERIHTGVAALYHETLEAMEVARGERFPVAEGAAVDYLFDIIRRDGVVEGAVTIRWRAGDAEGARAEIPKRVVVPAAYTISRENPRVVAVSPTTPEVAP